MTEMGRQKMGDSELFLTLSTWKLFLSLPASYGFSTTWKLFLSLPASYGFSTTVVKLAWNLSMASIDLE